MGRYRAARTGARLQGPARLDHADFRCRGRRHRADRGQDQAAGIGAELRQQTGISRRAVLGDPTPAIAVLIATWAAPQAQRRRLEPWLRPSWWISFVGDWFQRRPL